jgi:HK97 family phage major capsid protein
MNKKYFTERKNKLITRAEEIVNKCEEEKRELTEDEAAELAEIRDDVKRIKDALDISDDLDDMKEKAPQTTTEENKPPMSGTETRALEEEKAFADALRGIVDMNNRAAATNFTDTNSVTIPETIADKIWTKVVDKSPILERSTRYNMKGDLVLPYYDTTKDKITVAWSEEFTELESHAGDFTQITLKGYLAGALSLISNKLINNSKFDIVNFVVEQMSDSISEFIENTLLNGSANVDGLKGVTQAITTASATAITADEVIKLKDSIKDTFQNNAIWIMSNATRTALRLLKDSTGRYLLNDDINSAFGTTLLGKDVYVSDNMPEIAAGNNVIYYGDMSGLATKFSEDEDIQVLREKYATMHATGVVAWIEFDAKVADTQAIAKMTMKSA